MSELLDAAKAVIEKWDLIKPEQVPSYIKELHAAVDRAETAIKDTDAYEHGYIAGQKAMKAHERERIKVIINYQFGDLVSDLSDVMEMIDE